MFREVKKIIHRFCSSKGIFDSVIISFIVTVFFFIIYFILFYLNDSVVLISPRLPCYATVLFAFHHCKKKPTKWFKGVVSLSFIGSLCTLESGTLAVWQCSSVAVRLSAGGNTYLSSWVSISCSGLEVKTLSLTSVITEHGHSLSVLFITVGQLVFLRLIVTVVFTRVNYYNFPLLILQLPLLRQNRRKNNNLSLVFLWYIIYLIWQSFEVPLYSQ